MIAQVDYGNLEAILKNVLKFMNRYANERNTREK